MSTGVAFWERKEAQVKETSRAPKQQAEFLLKDGNMKGKYLGACLDNCRWGSIMTVMYEMTVKEMVSFAQNWMQQNKNDFPKLFHGENPGADFELPYIKHKLCPRNKKHKGIIKDCAGRVRCAHHSEIKLKPNYATSYSSFDKESGTRRIEYLESPPHENFPDPDELIVASSNEGGVYDTDWKKEQEEYERELEKYEKEEPSLIVTDFCYSILSDRGVILPLETIIKRVNLRPEFDTNYCDSAGIGPCTRLNDLSKEERKEYEESGLEICPGHQDPHDKIEFDFDGWYLAHYVQKWWEQLPNGKAPLYEKQATRQAS